MFATSLIVFRETLEAALFVGIIAASTRGLAERGFWLLCGVLAGFMGSIAMALGMGQISDWADGIGQELLSVIVIAVALLMLTWHCVWVSTHNREMVQGARQLGAAATKGTSTLWALSLAVALSVLREGAETVIFVAGFMSGSSEGRMPLLMGASLGLVAGTLSGILIYFSLARIKTQHLFSVTNGLILILAGSLASQLAKTLIQAGLVNHGAEPVWNISSILANDSALGVFLHAFMGYDANPAGLQLLFYIGAISAIWFASRQARTWQARDRGAALIR